MREMLAHIAAPNGSLPDKMSEKTFRNDKNFETLGPPGTSESASFVQRKENRKNFNASSQNYKTPMSSDKNPEEIARALVSRSKETDSIVFGNNNTAILRAENRYLRSQSIKET
jgi:hypothetical protein